MAIWAGLLLLPKNKAYIDHRFKEWETTIIQGGCHFEDATDVRYEDDQQHLWLQMRVGNVYVATVPLEKPSKPETNELLLSYYEMLKSTVCELAEPPLTRDDFTMRLLHWTTGRNYTPEYHEAIDVLRSMRGVSVCVYKALALKYLDGMQTCQAIDPLCDRIARRKIHLVV